LVQSFLKKWWVESDNSQLIIFPCFYSDIEDPDLSDSFVAEQYVTFKVVETGTKRKAKRLVSSDGYSYNVKVYYD
jgi:hypothetical protein